MSTHAAEHCTAHLDHSQFDDMRGPRLLYHCDHPCTNNSSTVTAPTARKAVVLPGVAARLRRATASFWQQVQAKEHMFEDVPNNGWIEQPDQSNLLAILVPCSAWRALLHQKYQQKRNKGVALHG